MTPWAHIENIVIYLVIGVVALGGVLVTGQWYGLFGLVLMFGMNMPKGTGKD